MSNGHALPEAIVGGGDRLPTGRQVALDLGVSAGTAARAFKMLEAEGLA